EFNYDMQRAEIRATFPLIPADRPGPRGHPVRAGPWAQVAGRAGPGIRAAALHDRPNDHPAQTHYKEAAGARASARAGAPTSARRRQRRPEGVAPAGAALAAGPSATAGG